MDKNETLLEWLLLTIQKRFSPKDEQGCLFTHRRRGIRNEVMAYYEQHPTQDAEINEALAFLKQNKFHYYFPYPFISHYKVADIHIEFDETGLPYYDYPDGKRLFLRRSSAENAAKTVNGILLEQDAKSAHRYLTDTFNVGADDVVADVGSAEANLTLAVIDRVKHAYLFECDEAWIEPLEKTFAPWKEKVTIVKHLVTDNDEGDNLTLGTYFKSQPLKPTFVKLDVEGYEKSVMDGMGELWNTPNLKMDVCAYHKADAYTTLKAYLESKGMTCETSDSYMLVGFDSYQPPYFRRGMLRAKKIEN